MSGPDLSAGVVLDALVRALPERRSPDDFRLAATLIAEVCAALHAGHELAGPDGAPLGVVHGALTPKTIAVLADGAIRLLDFGDAGTTQRHVGSLGEASAYLAPEQVRGQTIDRRADVFAAGTVLFELCTGRSPFQRGNQLLTFKAILDEPVPPPTQLQPELTPAFAAVMARALARDPNERFPTARALGDALLDAIAPLGGPFERAEIPQRIRALLAPAPPAEGPRAPTPPRFVTPAVGALQPISPPPPRQAPPRRTRLVAGGLAAAAVAAGALWIATVGRKRSAPAPAGPVASAPPSAPRATTGAAALPPPSPPVRRPARRPAGFVTIDSRPHATIFVGDRKLGDTPLVRAPLPAGRHTVRAVLANGREQRFAVTVRPGRAAPPRRLRW